MLDESAPSVAGAVQWLQRFRLPTAREANHFLQNLLAQTECLRLYQHYFPEEFMASAASVQPPGDRLRLREREFLKLVNERLFPLSEWYLDELWAEAGQDWFDLIPLCQINPILDEDDADLAWPIRAFMAMLTGAEEVWAEIKEQLGLDVPRPIALDWSNFTLNWAAFTSLCEQAGELVAGVPTVIDVVGRDTGNFWLDYDDEMMFSAGLSWTDRDDGRPGRRVAGGSTHHPTLQPHPGLAATKPGATGADRCLLEPFDGGKTR